jgi:hypothetical protein
MFGRSLTTTAVAGLVAGVAYCVFGTSEVGAQQTAPPYTPPTEAIPPTGPYDPQLRSVPLANGKKLHLLPATLETTQWGWFDNAQPPVLRINSGDSVVMETMMHSHNQVVPGTTIEQIRSCGPTFPAAARTL